MTKVLEPGNEKRELGGLLEAMDEFRLKIGFIITENQEDEKKFEGKTIKIAPIWKWLLES